MIWTTVSSRSYFSWLYIASPSLATKKVVSLISVLTICWFPCVKLSLVSLKKGICYDQCILLAEIQLAFALLHFVLQGQTCLLLQVSRDFLILYSIPLWWKDIFFFDALDILVSVHRTVNSICKGLYTMLK